MFTPLFDAPFRESVSAEDVDGALYPVSVDGQGYLVDTTDKYRFGQQSIDIQKTMVNTQKNDSALLAPEVWRRLAETWHFGAGQRWLDKDESVPQQFDNSIGINVWDQYRLSLLNDVAVLDTHTGEGTLPMVVNQTHLIVAGSNHLHWHADLTAGAGTSQTLAGTIASITTDGLRVFAALSNGTIVSSTGPGATPVVQSTLTGVSVVRWVKDRLIAGVGNVLWDCTAVGAAPVKIGESQAPGFHWVDVAPGLNVTYFLGGVGDTFTVWKAQEKGDGTGLEPPSVAVQLPDGEVGYAIGAYLGYIFVGTKFGIRFASASSIGDLTLGSVIETANPVRCFEGQGRFVWAGLTNQRQGMTGLARLSLADFTAPLTPAYASDLQIHGIEGDVTSVVTFQDVRVFSVSNGGIYREDLSRLVPSGEIEQGIVEFNVPDEKSSVYTVVRHTPLRGEVYVDQSYDGGEWTRVGRSTSQGSTASPHLRMDGKVYRSMQNRLTLLRDDDDPLHGPTITRWETRALPNSGTAIEFVVPLILADTVEVDGTVRNRDVLAEGADLVALAESAKVFRYREGLVSWDVNATGYQFYKQKKSTLRDGWQGVFVITMRSIQ